MKKKVLAMLTTALLLLPSLNVCAAELPINYNNNWIVSGSTDASYTIPYSGNYTVSVSGAQGGSYSSNGAGGKGFTRTQTFWLNKGQTVSFELGMVPNWYKSGSSLVIPAGGVSSFKVDGVTKLTADGGPGRINYTTAIDGVTSVSMAGGSASIHWHTGNGKSGPYLSNAFPTAYQRDGMPNGCYINGSHSHDSKCELVALPLDHSHCTYHNVKDEYGNDDGPKSWVEHHCIQSYDHKGDTRNNVWNLGCGHTQGQIYGISHGAEGDNSGGGRYTIQLAECQNLQMYNTIVSWPSYRSGKAYLVLKDDTVSYFKRH